eukprot:699334-Rhodomonas_salina.1
MSVPDSAYGARRQLLCQYQRSRSKLLCQYRSSHRRLRDDSTGDRISRIGGSDSSSGDGMQCEMKYRKPQFEYTLCEECGFLYLSSAHLELRPVVALLLPVEGDGAADEDERGAGALGQDLCQRAQNQRQETTFSGRIECKKPHFQDRLHKESV